MKTYENWYNNNKIYILDRDIFENKKSKDY